MHAKNITVFSAALLLIFSAALPTAALEGAPIAENMELRTYRGISLEGQLTATDPQGDAVFYEITTPPVKGEVTLSEDGTFLYTPREGKRGKDYFGYTATDTNGNKSQEATVIITLVKQKTNIAYADLEGLGCHYDAIRLAEEAVFVGEQLGGQYIFSPADSVTQGEFAAMCVAISDAHLPAGVFSTGLSDDVSIPTWQKPYIAAAMMSGALQAQESSFSALSPITYAQAAVLINDVFSMSNVHAAQFTASAPAWAAQALSNLVACDILSETADTNQILTRAAAAQMLSALMDVIEQR